MEVRLWHREVRRAKPILNGNSWSVSLTWDYPWTSPLIINEGE